MKHENTIVVVNRDGSKQRIYERDFDARKHKRVEAKSPAKASAKAS